MPFGLKIHHRFAPDVENDDEWTSRSLQIAYVSYTICTNGPQDSSPNELSVAMFDSIDRIHMHIVNDSVRAVC